MNRIHFRDKEPKYRQLYLYYRREIEAGKIEAREKMPSKRVLARQLGIGLRTVELAYEQLVAEGYVYSEERKGYFVSPLVNLAKEIRNSTVIKDESPDEKDYVYSFTLSGVEEEGFPWSVIRRLQRSVFDDHERHFLGGGEMKGERQLRENIAAYLRQARGFSPDPENIIISSGTESLLQLLFLLLSEESLALEDPGFSRLHTLCRDLGKTVYPLGFDAEGIRPEELNKTGCNLVFITPSHQFPTGLVYPVGRRLELLSWAMEKKERYLLEDDYDSEFRYGVHPLPSLKSLDRGDKVIYLGSFSKSLSPSFKLSYLVIPKALGQPFKELSYWSCPVSLSTQFLVSSFIAEGHYTRHLNRMRKIYKDKRELLVDAILEVDPEASLGGSDAGLFITLKPSVKGTEERLVKKARKKGIFLYGMHEFSLKKRVEEAVFLLGFASIKKERIKGAVEALYEAWRA